MRSIIISAFVFIFSITLNSCGKKEISDPKTFMSWVEDPEHGLVQVKYVNNVKLTVKYLTPTSQAYQELRNKKNASKREKDSLVEYYSKFKSFLLTIGPDDRKGKNSSDIMWRGVNKYEEYKERSLTMNFDMGELVSLETDKATFYPVLTNMENTYSLSNDRNVYLVFSDDVKNKDLESAEKLDLVYNDEIFNTGINHFVFTKDQFGNIPNFIF